MLRKHAQFWVSLFFISDLLVIALCWVFSCYLGFGNDSIRIPDFSSPPFSVYLQGLLPLWVIWGLIAKIMNLYRPRRIGSFVEEIWDISKGLTATTVVFVAVDYFFLRFEFFRPGFFYFWFMGVLILGLTRFAARRTLKSLRRHGYNRRFALIAGTGELGQEVLGKIELCSELGIHVTGFLSHGSEEVGARIQGIPVIGAYGDIERILRENTVDIFFIALPVQEYDHLEEILKGLSGQLADIKVVHGGRELLRLKGGLDELDGLPIMSLQHSPLYGWRRVFKALFDFILGSFFLIISSPAMILIAFLVKLTSKGPIFYRQERLGMNGRPFQMLKFRTMKVGAEAETGPVWTRENDSRRTGLGVFLRRTSLDELPQLWNVLKGDMSLVGPRPERPTFVEEFRNGVPSYMLRHKIKAGMTGWAQVNGWRGDTSVGKRIEHDLYYIQNWSILFDLKILFMTFWKGFFSKSAY
jgi:Undecaprenyl-phosphate glucose phosphotransferase